jgi:hypothetical protein
MQKVLDSISNEIERIISKPPSRPIRLIFFNSAPLCAFVQNKLIERFDNNEILNINRFFISKIYLESEEELDRLEELFGNESKKYQRKLAEILYQYIEMFVEEKNSSKLMLMDDTDLFSCCFDPIHFLSSYIFDDSSIIVQNEIPLFWFTLGQRDPYNQNIYRYYKTDSTHGRKIELKINNFGSCIIDYTSEY